MAAYREAIDAAVARAAEAGEGGEAYGHVAELLALFGRRFEAVKERRAGLDFEDLQLRAGSCSSVRRSATPTERASAT